LPAARPGLAVLPARGGADPEVGAAAGGAERLPPEGDRSGEGPVRGAPGRQEGGGVRRGGAGEGGEPRRGGAEGRAGRRPGEGRQGGGREEEPVSPRPDLPRRRAVAGPGLAKTAVEGGGGEAPGGGQGTAGAAGGLRRGGEQGAGDEGAYGGGRASE